MKSQSLSALVSLLPEFMLSSTLLKNAVYRLMCPPLPMAGYLNISDSYMCIFGLDKIVSCFSVTLISPKTHTNLDSLSPFTTTHIFNLHCFYCQYRTLSSTKKLKAKSQELFLSFLFLPTSHYPINQ